MPEEIVEGFTLKNAAMAATIALLSWGIYTVHQLAISTVALSQSVEYLVVENLPNRVTTLEIVVEGLQRNVLNLSE
jgi:predicted phosphatase